MFSDWLSLLKMFSVSFVWLENIENSSLNWSNVRRAKFFFRWPINWNWMRIVSVWTGQLLLFVFQHEWMLGNHSFFINRHIESIWQKPYVKLPEFAKWVFFSSSEWRTSQHNLHTKRSNKCAFISFIITTRMLLKAELKNEQRNYVLLWLAHCTYSQIKFVC